MIRHEQTTKSPSKALDSSKILNTANNSATLKRKLKALMGQHGINGILHALTEISSEFDEGNIGPGQLIDPCPVWLAIAAQLQNCSDNVDEILTPRL